MNNPIELRLACVVLESTYGIDNNDHTEILESVLNKIDDSIDVVLFPAGFYETDKPTKNLYKATAKIVQRTLKSTNKHCTVCLGIDGRSGKDQMAIAINDNGIIALGRKFYPTEDEDGWIKSADNYLSVEDNYSRIFELKGKKCYLAVCFDSYGIRHKLLNNPGVDIVLNLVHQFTLVGEGGSGEVYFAKHGFAGAAKQWKCCVFGAAAFIDRKIPERWPTGVVWNNGDETTSRWKYEDNGIKPYNTIEIDCEKESAKVIMYDIANVDTK